MPQGTGDSSAPHPGGIGPAPAEGERRELPGGVPRLPRPRTLPGDWEKLTPWDYVSKAAIDYAEAIEAENDRDIILTRDRLKKAAIRYARSPRRRGGRPRKYRTREEARQAKNARNRLWHQKQKLRRLGAGMAATRAHLEGQVEGSIPSGSTTSTTRTS